VPGVDVGRHWHVRPAACLPTYRCDRSLCRAVRPSRRRGQYTDPQTGLQYLQARYYDPTTGQFLTRDPLGAVTGQPYSYANDNPTNAKDPTGLNAAGLMQCGPGSPNYPQCQNGGPSLTDVGIGLGVLSLGTGLGEAVGLGEGVVGGISILTGGAAAGLDAQGCANGNQFACVTGVVGGGAFVGGIVGAVGAGVVGAGAKAIGVTLGGIGFLGDAAGAANGAALEGPCGEGAF
jgi:RHS repeat-associated protein